MKLRHLLVACALLVSTNIALAQASADAASTVLGLLQTSMQPAIGKLTTQAISWLGVFSVLQFFITNYNLLKTDGDIQSVVAKAAGAIAWVSICLYLINNGPAFVNSVGDQMLGLVGFDMPSPGAIITKTMTIAATLVTLALGLALTPLVGDTAGSLMLYLSFAVLGMGMFFAFKVFMIQLETTLVAMLAPLSFAFLGMNMLRDQGIAPFKALISLGYRIILMTVILSCYSTVSTTASDAITNIKDIGAWDLTKGFGDIMNTLLTCLAEYILLAYLTFKSDSIAASLASGSTSMGTADVAGAAAAGAAMGAAAMTAGGSVAAAASKPPQGMANFMKKLVGGGQGSISNASSMGSGGSTPSLAPPPPSAPASLSLGGASVHSGPMSTVGAGLQSGSPAGSQGSSAGQATGAALSSSAGAATSRVGLTSGRYGLDAAGAGRAGQQETSGAAASGGQLGAADGSGQQETSGSFASGGQFGAVGVSSDGAAGSNADWGTITPSAPAAPRAGAQSEALGAGLEQRAKQMPGTTAERPHAAAQLQTSSPEPAPAASSGSAPGSGLSAGIGGKQTDLERDLSKLVDHLASQGARKPTFGERLAEAGRHVSQEEAATHVSINPHHHD